LKRRSIEGIKGRNVVVVIVLGIVVKNVRSLTTEAAAGM
jgi:hypothetical protein